jgi:hypothetical protein
MGYRMNIRGASAWSNLLKDTHVEITDSQNHFTSSNLEGALNELFSLASSGMVWNSVIMDTTASAFNGYFVNTSSNEVIITLPSSASIGDTIKISDVSGSFFENKCTIARNGHTIMGLAENLDCDINNLCIELVYSNMTNGWRITNFTV